MEHSGYIIYVMDTETTGLDPEENDVIEISMCRFYMDSPDEIEQKTWLLRPLNPMAIDDKALKINGHKREDILGFTKFGKENYLEPEVIVAQIEQWIMDDDQSIIDRVVAGQNILFDIRFLKGLWKKVGNEDTFPFSVENDNRIFDTKMFALAIDICTGRRRRFYNLKSLVESFGAKKLRAHRADADTLMTVDVFRKMLEPIASALEVAFKDSYSDKDQ